ncbi:MAG: hypothetical protein JNM91_13305, partial [Flavobacteriales bacterium]|nr:hypothetical protein [Flavobacteriales bacterium]
MSASVDAGQVGAITLCSTNAPVGLFTVLTGTPDAGGSWTTPGGGTFSGTFNPAEDAGGVYLYIVQAVDPCPAASSAVTVTVIPAPDAGGNGAAAYCSDAANLDLFNLLQGDPQGGGTWIGPDAEPCASLFDPGVSPAGAYTYRVAAIAPCVQDEATVTISVVQAPFAGTDGAITLCADADPFLLNTLLGGGPDAGGTWTTPDGAPTPILLDPANAGSGAYTYTVEGTAPCLADVATVNVQVDPVPAPEISVILDGGCAPVTAYFMNNYQGPGNSSWTFGNGDTTSAAQPAPVVFEEAGSYTITLTMTTESGCSATAALVDAVQVATQPTAAFQMLTGTLNTGAPEAFFQNGSTGAVAYEWDFATLGSSTETHPTFTFPGQLEATYTVCLTAFATDYCSDTACSDFLVPAGMG